MDLRDGTRCPGLEGIRSAVRCPAFEALCSWLETVHRAKASVEFSRCSMEYGWNVKYKKAGKTLCTMYPREGCFTAMVVVGRKEKEAVEEALPDMTEELRQIYGKTREGNGQRWLMIDLEDEEGLYEDVLRLVDIRAGVK